MSIRKHGETNNMGTIIRAIIVITIVIKRHNYRNYNNHNLSLPLLYGSTNYVHLPCSSKILYNELVWTFGPVPSFWGNIILLGLSCGWFVREKAAAAASVECLQVAQFYQLSTRSLSQAQPEITLKWL